MYNPVRKTNSYVVVMFPNGITGTYDMHLANIQRGDW